MEFHLPEQYIPSGQVKADPPEFGAVTSSGAIFPPAKSRVSRTCVAQFHVHHDCAHSIGRFNRGAQRWSALFFRGFSRSHRDAGSTNRAYSSSRPVFRHRFCASAKARRGLRQVLLQPRRFPQVVGHYLVPGPSVTCAIRSLGRCCKNRGWTSVSTGVGRVSDFDGPQNRNYLVGSTDVTRSLVIAASYRSAAF